MEASFQDVFNQLEEARDKERMAKYGEKPIILSDQDRQRIEKAIGHNVSTPDELVSRIERALQVSVAEVSIPLTPHLLTRLQSRAIRVPFDTFMKSTVKRLLEEFVGLR